MIDQETPLPLQMFPPPGARIAGFGSCGGISRSVVQAPLASGLEIAVLDWPSAIESVPPPSETVVHACDATKGAEATDALAAAQGQLRVIGRNRSDRQPGWLQQGASYSRRYGRTRVGRTRRRLPGECISSRPRGLPLLRRGHAPTFLNASSTLG
ncbi:MAG: hypothetical protein ACI9W2_003677, partial [Gammaproteobacteria bacterium]